MGFLFEGGRDIPNSPKDMGLPARSEIAQQLILANLALHNAGETACSTYIDGEVYGDPIIGTPAEIQRRHDMVNADIRENGPSCVTLGPASSEQLERAVTKIRAVFSEVQ